MGESFTDEELIAERKRAQKLADICMLHGHIDGVTAMRAILNAITQEQVERSRRNG